MAELRISHYVDETKVLGPFVRSALWVHGCCFNCEGCLAREMNSREYKAADAEKLAEHFLSVKDTDGITISGGEPFLQAEALSLMIRRIRDARPDYGVIIYTGFTFEELKDKNNASTNELLGMADIIIDGRYVKELDDGVPYRGSSNQRILLLTDRYKDISKEYYNTSGKRNIEIQVTGKNIYMVGVPSENGLKIWEDLERKAEVSGNNGL